MATAGRWGRYAQGKGEKVVLSQSRSRDTVYGDTIRNEVKHITYRYKGNQQKNYNSARTPMRGKIRI